MPAVGSTWVIVVHWVMRVDGVVAVRRGRHLSSLRSRARPPPLSFMSSRRGNLDAISDQIHRFLSSDSVKNDASPPYKKENGPMATNLIDLIKGYLTPEIVAGAASYVGESGQDTYKAISGLVPTTVAALGNMAATKTGAQQISQMLDSGKYD